MLRSSLGFHTIKLFMVVSREVSELLLRAFKAFSKATGGLHIYPEDGPIRYKLEYIGGKYVRKVDETARTYRIVYYHYDVGLEWKLRFCNWSRDFQTYIVEAKINPKVLGGVTDYITAATIVDIDAAEAAFNREAEKISPLLSQFSDYAPNRIDYCLNGDLRKLGYPCTPEQMMILAKRADIPPKYAEWTRYCPISHRHKSDPASYYLKSKSVNISFYSKYMELKKRSDERVKKGLAPIPGHVLEAALNVMRFEVQCKYPKVHNMSRRVLSQKEYDFEESWETIQHGYNSCDALKDLLADDMCKKVIDYYYKRVFVGGSYYTLKDAKELVKSHEFRTTKAERMLDTLERVNQQRSISRARASLSILSTDFGISLNELADIGINPVTLPKEFGIKSMPNLLDAHNGTFAATDGIPALTDTPSFFI